MSYQDEKYRQLADRFEGAEAKDPLKRKHAAISDDVQAASEPSYKVQDIETPQAGELRGFATSVTHNLDCGFVVSVTVRYPGINGDDGAEFTYPTSRASKIPVSPRASGLQ